MQFNGTKYAYIHNLQGDIVGLIDTSGTEVVKYTYDAWGKVLSTTGSLAATLGTIQPFRYRGYIYDVETGLYYLRIRYYKPEDGRFLNADNQMGSKENFFGFSLFTYCSNKCLLYLDSSGHEESYIDNDEDGYIAAIISGISWSGYAPNSSFYYFNSNGEKYVIWSDGNGDIYHTRHYSDHGNPSVHKNPHDHTITKDKDGKPIQSKPSDKDDNFSDSDAEELPEESYSHNRANLMKERRKLDLFYQPTPEEKVYTVLWTFVYIFAPELSLIPFLAF